jgi:hypothetical protein
MIQIHVSTPPTLTALADRAQDAVSRVVYDAGATLLTRIRANASTGFHRRGLPHIPGTGPGPNVATGDYRRTWALATGRDAAGNASAVVSTNSPQARRLEYGFTDVDSLGRAFTQPPYPHVRPAVDATRPELIADLRVAVLRLTRGA